MAVSIDSGWTLALTGALIIPLVTFVVLSIADPFAGGVVRTLSRTTALRPLGAIATRHRTPATVRLVVVAAVVVAAGVSILGASVEARPDRERLLDRRLAQLPVLPPNLALVRIEPERPFFFGGGDKASERAELSPELRTTLTSAIPHSTTIVLHHLEAVPFTLFCDDCNRPVVVAEPKLRRIYGSDLVYPVDATILPFDLSNTAPYNKLHARHASRRARPSCGE